MEKINTMQDLIKWFEGLADGSIKPFCNGYGLCSQIDEVYENYMTDEFISKWDTLVEMDNIYASWDKFSGRHCYPVPAPICEDAVEDITCPEGMYDYYIDHNLDMWEGAYGDLRKDLCRHVANELRKLV
jgi:hypothetical protein